MSKDPDRRLVMLAKKGNRSAFGKLVRKYQDQILGLAYDYLGNYDAARDAAQEVFIKAWDKFDGFGEKSKFSTWLYRIAVNQCLDELRKQAVRRSAAKQMQTHLADLPAPGPPADLFELEKAGLSEAQYTAILLKYYQDLPVGEIAEIMACSEATVRTHLFRAIKKIRLELD